MSDRISVQLCLGVEFCTSPEELNFESGDLYAHLQQLSQYTGAGHYAYYDSVVFYIKSLGGHESTYHIDTALTISDEEKVTLEDLRKRVQEAFPNEYVTAGAWIAVGSYS